MKTIVVNGANGYVASNFIARLLKTGNKVVALVRPGHKQTPEERMNSVLADIEENETLNTQNLSVYAYSLLEKDFAMEEKILTKVFKTNVDYFHFAASLKYDEKSVDEIFTTNIEGVRNSIDVFQKYASKKSRFFYIGTAYSCGKYNDVFEEKFYKNEPISSFRNYYELSKRYGENIVCQSIEKSHLNGHVIRLSQVVGDHRTGITKTDYGIFDFSKRIYKLARRYPNEVVRVKVDPASTQNLIPIGTVVSYLLQAVQTDTAPRIMNLVAKRSIKNEQIINTLNEVLPITLIPQQNLNRNSMNSLERLISIGMSFTGSYTETNLKFDTSRRDEIIQPGEDDELNDESVYAMLQYFVRTLSAQKRKTVAA
ncbi:SDR family oxidoreductase [Maribellus maritimus]|uniref:SDR family oxidoreductase n=1 Tax=Maribellus maritimus TaxID=2870838 RepID=UPI001EEB8A28|nr:SDR family oxidoreductase [Maribellus maritimus]MCG6190398.1 SDR family oxidoreductase [Maribellus maritimus]